MTDDEPTPLTAHELAEQENHRLRLLGERACAADKQLYAKLLVEVTTHYKGQSNGFRRCLNEVHRRAGLLAERSATSAG